MYATVTTWLRAASSHLPEEDFLFLRELTSGGIGIVRGHGVLDVLMVEIEPDRLVVVSTFETLEDALAAGPRILACVAEWFAGRLELISRVTGTAYEPTHFAPVDRGATHQWREEAEAMYASIATWRLDRSIRDPEALSAYLQHIADQVVALLARLGLLDVLVVRVADDTLFVLRLFADPVAFEAAMQMAAEAALDLVAGKLELVERVSGRAYDVAQLLSR